MKKVIIIVILIIVIVIGAIYLTQINNESDYVILEDESEISYVIIDINPSVQLSVDNNDEVLDVITLNEDADIAFCDVDVIGDNIDDAIETIIDTSIELGYITELSDTNAINVTSSSENETIRTRLNDKVVNKSSKYLEAQEIYALVVVDGLNEDIKSKDDEYEIPYGKMLLVQRANRLNDTITEEELVNLSIKEIQNMIIEQSRIRREEIITRLKEDNQELKDLKTQRRVEVNERIATQKENILKDATDDKQLLPEQRETIINQRKEEIRNEINNITDELKQDEPNIQQEVKEKYFRNNR